MVENGYLMRFNSIKIFLMCLVTALLWSCSPTKHVPQGKYLVDNVSINIEDTEDVTLVKPKKEKGIGGLVFTICLELLAITGIVAYWLLYIL